MFKKDLEIAEKIKMSNGHPSSITLPFKLHRQNVKRIHQNHNPINYTPVRPKLIPNNPNTNPIPNKSNNSSNERGRTSAGGRYKNITKRKFCQTFAKMELTTTTVTDFSKIGKIGKIDKIPKSSANYPNYNQYNPRPLMNSTLAATSINPMNPSYNSANPPQSPDLKEQNEDEQPSPQFKVLVDKQNEQFSTACDDKTDDTECPESKTDEENKPAIRLHPINEELQQQSPFVTKKSLLLSLNFPQVHHISNQKNSPDVQLMNSSNGRNPIQILKSIPNSNKLTFLDSKATKDQFGMSLNFQQTTGKNRKDPPTNKSQAVLSTNSAMNSVLNKHNSATLDQDTHTHYTNFTMAPPNNPHFSAISKAVMNVNIESAHSNQVTSSLSKDTSNNNNNGNQTNNVIQNTGSQTSHVQNTTPMTTSKPLPTSSKPICVKDVTVLNQYINEIFRSMLGRSDDISILSPNLTHPIDSFVQLWDRKTRKMKQHPHLAEQQLIQIDNRELTRLNNEKVILKKFATLKLDEGPIRKYLTASNIIKKMIRHFDRIIFNYFYSDELSLEETISSCYKMCGEDRLVAKNHEEKTGNYGEEINNKDLSISWEFVNKMTTEFHLNETLFRPTLKEKEYKDIVVGIISRLMRVFLAANGSRQLEIDVLLTIVIKYGRKIFLSEYKSVLAAYNSAGINHQSSDNFASPYQTITPNTNLPQNESTTPVPETGHSSAMRDTSQGVTGGRNYKSYNSSLLRRIEKDSAMGMVYYQNVESEFSFMKEKMVTYLKSFNHYILRTIIQYQNEYSHRHKPNSQSQLSASINLKLASHPTKVQRMIQKHLEKELNQKEGDKEQIKRPNSRAKKILLYDDEEEYDPEEEDDEDQSQDDDDDDELVSHLQEKDSETSTRGSNQKSSESEAISQGGFQENGSSHNSHAYRYNAMNQNLNRQSSISNSATKESKNAKFRRISKIINRTPIIGRNNGQAESMRPFNNLPKRSISNHTYRIYPNNQTQHGRLSITQTRKNTDDMKVKKNVQSSEKESKEGKIKSMDDVKKNALRKLNSIIEYNNTKIVKDKHIKLNSLYGYEAAVKKINSSGIGLQIERLDQLDEILRREEKLKRINKFSNQLWQENNMSSTSISKSIDQDLKNMYSVHPMSPPSKTLSNKIILSPIQKNIPKSPSYHHPSNSHMTKAKPDSAKGYKDFYFNDSRSRQSSNSSFISVSGHSQQIHKTTIQKEGNNKPSYPGDCFGSAHMTQYPRYTKSEIRQLRGLTQKYTANEKRKIILVAKNDANQKKISSLSNSTENEKRIDHEKNQEFPMKSMQEQHKIQPDGESSTLQTIDPNELMSCRMKSIYIQNKKEELIQKYLKKKMQDPMLVQIIFQKKLTQKDKENREQYHFITRVVYYSFFKRIRKIQFHWKRKITLKVNALKKITKFLKFVVQFKKITQRLKMSFFKAVIQNCLRKIIKKRKLYKMLAENYAPLTESLQKFQEPVIKKKIILIQSFWRKILTKKKFSKHSRKRNHRKKWQDFQIELLKYKRNCWIRENDLETSMMEMRIYSHIWQTDIKDYLKLVETYLKSNVSGYVLRMKEKIRTDFEYSDWHKTMTKQNECFYLNKQEKIKIPATIDPLLYCIKKNIRRGLLSIRRDYFKFVHNYMSAVWFLENQFFQHIFYGEPILKIVRLEYLS